MDGNTSQYTGEKMHGELKTMPLFGVDPNEFVKLSYGKLANRCSTLYHISAPARACVNKPLDYAIGKGLVFRSLPDYRFLGMSPESAKEWGKRFSKLLHYEKKAVNYYKKQKVLSREASITGDAILYLLREDNSNNPFDLITSIGDSIDWTKSDEKGYTLGIKHDSYGRRFGFWSKQDNKEILFRDSDGFQNAIQYGIIDRAGQMRGMSVFHSEISRAKNLDRVWDAIVERMVLEAIQLGYFQASGTDVYKQASNLAVSSYETADSSEGVTVSKVPELNQLGGGIYTLKNGESLQFTDLKTPSDNFDMANEWYINFLGMATGIPPEVIMGKYSTSFTAHKGALNDFMKMYENVRENYITIVENTLTLEYLKHFASTGQIEVSPAFWTDYKTQMAYINGIYLGPIPGHINPLVEVNADIKAEEAGYVLKSSNAMKYGTTDFDSAIEEWGEERDRWYMADPEKRQEALFNDLQTQSNEEDQ